MKMSLSDHNTAIKFIWKLLDAGLAAQMADKENHYLYDWFRKASLGNGISFADGATKAVFISFDFDWVIKVNLPGEEFDWCGREYENYRLAEERGLGYYFAASEFLGEFEGIKFYAQEYVDCDEGVDSEIYDSLKARYKSSDNDVDDDCLWGEVEELDAEARVELLYNDDALVRFIWERRINDLHCGNFGIKGDHYVMIDYSGFGAGVFREREA